MGNHKQALEIYVFRMRDYIKAEEYVGFFFFLYSLFLGVLLLSLPLLSLLIIFLYLFGDIFYHTYTDDNVN